MNQDAEHLVALLAGREIDVHKLGDLDWERIIGLAQKTGVAPGLFAALKAKEVTPPPASADAEDYAGLQVRVQPVDAIVTIDGQLWMPAAPGYVVVQVAEGVHHVEVSKPGYRSFATDVTLEQGKIQPLNVSLAPGAP